MGIFSKTNKQSESKASATVIGEGTFIRGGIETTGSIFVDGKFEGVIVAGESLTIGKTGEVIGDIKTKTLTVSGMLDGLIDAEDVNILQSGKILGKMQYQNLSIDKNGIFEGEGKMKNSTLVSKYKSIDIKEEDLKISKVQELIEEA